MRFAIGSTIFLLLLFALDPGDKFSEGDCILKNDKLYVVFEVTGDDYYLYNGKDLFVVPKRKAHKEFVPGVCK